MELDKGCNNLKNVSQVCGSISNVEQIESKVDNMVKVVVTKLYKGKNTDSIETVVDNDSYEIYANLTQIQYSSVSQFPKMGSDRLIYVNKADNSLWRYDTDTSQYSKVGNFDIVNLVGTQENPIHLGEDIELGKIYFISGWYRTYSSSARELPTEGNKYLCYAIGIDSLNRKSIVIFGCHVSGTLSRDVNEGSGTIITTGDGYDDGYNYFSSLSSLNGNYNPLTTRIYAPTNSGTTGQILQSNGTNNAPTWIDMPSGLPVTETFMIESSSWSELSDSSPYTYSATVTATTTIGTNSIVELINNQAVLFATYGFAIGSISGQNITIYSIGQPSESVTLTLEVTG